MPFMRVGTYPTGNYATLGPSQLQPPFTGDSILRLHAPYSLTGTGQASDLIPLFSNSQSPVFLVNSRPPRFTLNSRTRTTKLPSTASYPLSLSYKAILPSSFNILTSMHLSTLQLTYLCRFSVRFSLFEKYFPDACTLPDTV